MNGSGSAPANAHRARTQRGIAAVCEYLEAKFPGADVEILERSSDDTARRVRTFTLRRGDEAHRVQVTDEVLDRGADGATGLLRAFQVARVLRENSLGSVVVVTTTGLCVD